MSDASNGDSDLLTSPLAGAGISRLFVFGGPIGLALSIVLGLWVSYLHVRFTAVVQAPTTLAAGRSFSVRAQVVPEGSATVPALVGDAWIERDGARLPLGGLEATDGGVLQATVTTPPLEPGPAMLYVSVRSDPEDAMEPILEVVPIEIAAALPTLEPRPLVAGSTLQHGDDSDPQPADARIVVRPEGRLLSEFHNTLWVRVTKPDGTPWVGEVEVALVSGAFAGETGGDAQQPVLARGALDPWGVMPVRGVLSSAVLRVEVRVLGADGRPLHRRMLRMVSFAGGVVLRTDALSVSPTEPTLELSVESLRPKQPVYVDVHDPRGAWISTVTPPLRVGEPPRAWTAAQVMPGVLQLEAYPAPNAPGESTALARVQVVEGDASTFASLRPLVELHQAKVGAPRVEAGYASALETQYWKAVEGISLTAAQVEQARAFLIGTLPLSSYGPEVALVNRDRVLQEMATKKANWTLAMRVILLGGGGAFLLLMTLTMMRSHAQGARSTMAALARITHEDERADAELEVARAKRTALLRGLGVIAVMALSLLGVTLLFESLLWAH